ncbi:MULTISPECIES: TonB-dependent receptor [unclassified Novosphingobium]|uniref:TonB-dependent receptor n=1 Tax=unclassified Novosphingobium TaxID=2644732 RepID=UPI0014949F09|nr:MULTISPECIES: TonB-dependent receptor [unclassified Novosphingobium]MBB3357873.1 iron complex outermembrane receptor protein [Novosphingobium sp. BK256]MBB3374234.1 iron complex outermembrane receptor protein [Novosphingobium sp. BK280]MBB3378646.1 iron complex outermembrane receptor protein [Novosphingobium sp. BK258]MBB3420340.1 iron complex outermembrane receptor protein [Novosphingobium sp. BK267]MBB3448538.1 iron complex outermembrane receptor protein [Novosphingobium sp. BK352]
MIKHPLRAALLAASSLLACTAHAADAPATAAAEAAPAASDPQSTTANQAGQANDAQSLTSSDIIVTGSRAAQVAPITASLTTTQPQAAVSREFIDNANAASDFNQLIALTPSVSISGSNNGTGFTETKATIRGFQDGDYNVTYDSIPFADTNNPTHHSTAFFPTTTIETVVVDRGPGNASQLGQATYGGNINMYSRAVSDQMGGQVQGLLGNWNTFIGRAEFQSGAIDKLGGAKFVVAGQFLRSDGALTNSPVNSKNLFAKAVIPIGTANTLTLLSTWNRNFYYQSDLQKGATCGTGGTALAAGTQLTADNCTPTSQIGQYGLNYGLGSDPTKQDYWKYNRTDKTTDFSYIRLQSKLAPGLSMDNRAYMYGYTNNTLSGNTGSVLALSGAGTVASPYKTTTVAGDIPGYYKLNKYRVLGYIGQVNYDFALGKIRVGGWYEHADTDRARFDLDRTTGMPSYNEKFAPVTGVGTLPSAAYANINYLQYSKWNQYQLFAEFEFHPIEALSITPGVKYVHFNRSISGPVNQKSRNPIDTAATWTKTLPFATINWQAKENWSFYGQYAQGMYVPDLSSFYTPSGTSTDQAVQQQNLAKLQPQTSTNYQVGTVWHGSHVSVDVDGYIINVNNKIAADTSTGAPSNALVNIGQVRYKGVEGQVSFVPVTGLTLFANGSYNYAHSVTSGAQIASAPFSTAALGAFYNHNGTRVSFSQKFTGPQYATEATAGATGPRSYRIAPYGVGEFAISQMIANRFRIGATVSNVFNNRAITSIANGKTYGVDDQFQFLAPRSFMVDARITF